MPITRSAKKAVKTSATKKAFNDRRRRTMREAVKSVRSAMKDNSAEAQAKLSDAYKAIDKAAKRGVIKKNTAARKKSRLAAAIAKASK
jgi:small subunit ribosomal protein S20